MVSRSYISSKRWLETQPEAYQLIILNAGSHAQEVGQDMLMLWKI